MVSNRDLKKACGRAPALRQAQEPTMSVTEPVEGTCIEFLTMESKAPGLKTFLRLTALRENITFFNPKIQKKHESDSVLFNSTKIFHFEQFVPSFAFCE